MLTLLFSLSMAEIAVIERRRGWLWGSLTFSLSATIQTYLVSGYWGALMGFLISFGAMVTANFKFPVKKGPTLG